MPLLSLVIISASLLLIAVLSFLLVKPNSIAVITKFGRYSHFFGAGIHFRIPVIHQIYKRISLCVKAADLHLSLRTADDWYQNINLIINFTLLNSEVETIKQIAFQFVDEKHFLTALAEALEKKCRSITAKKNQAELQLAKAEINEKVKSEIESCLREFGYKLVEFNFIDSSFSKEQKSRYANLRS